MFSRCNSEDGRNSSGKSTLLLCHVNTREGAIRTENTTLKGMEDFKIMHRMLPSFSIQMCINNFRDNESNCMTFTHRFTRLGNLFLAITTWN